MAGLNQVTLIGNLGQDVTLRETPTGTKVANFDIATSEVRSTDNGTIQHTEWHKIVVWNKSAENSAKFLRKGSKVAITGALRTRSWEDKSHTGVRHYVTEIHAKSVEFLDKIAKPKNRRPDAPPQDEEHPESENPAPEEQPLRTSQQEEKPTKKKAVSKKKKATKKTAAKK